MESRPVSRVLSRTAIPLRTTSLQRFSNLPGSSAGHANGTLFGLAPSGVYLATDCCQPCGALLPHLFTLTGACALRRLFSVALSVGSRLPGITWHSALWSPDFPPPARWQAATVQPTLRQQGYRRELQATSSGAEKSAEGRKLDEEPQAPIACRSASSLQRFFRLYWRSSAT